MRNALMRAATLAPSTFDEKANTVEVTLSTGAAVQRGAYVEKLDIAGADLRGIEGAPVLDAHSQGSTRNVLGVIEKAWKAGGEIRALLKLSSRSDVAGIVADIRDGIIRNLSIGYAVSRWADSTDSKGNRIRTATQWKILEASFVPVGADAGATVRSDPNMKKRKNGAADPALEVENPEAGNDNEPQFATREQLLSIARTLPVEQRAEFVLEHVESTEEEARAAAFEEMQTRTQRGPRVRIVASHEDPSAIMERRVDALHARVTGATPKPEAREFMGVRLVDHARAMLAERGVSTLGLAPHDMLSRAWTTTDFPNMLTGTGNRVLLAQFEAAKSPLLRLGRQTTAPDFRPLNKLRISELGAMQELGGEVSEIQNVNRSELADSYKIGSAGLMVSVSFAAMQNDDLGALRDFSVAAGQSAAQYQKSKILDLIESNPTIEGNPLFSDAHGNIAHQAQSGFFAVGATDEGQSALGPLDEMRRAMRTQKSLDGVTTLNLAPKFLLVGADLETDSQMALARINPVTSADVNPFEGALELLVESDLAAKSWYAFAAVEAAPVFEHAWLEGYTGPQLAQQENFRTLGVDFRCVLHWGCGLLPGGWRGAFANFGADSSNS